MNVIALEKLNAILANIKSDEAIKDFNQKNKRKNIDAIQFLTDEKPHLMKLTLKRDLPLMLAVLLAIWCMWYARPVGVGTLFSGLEPDSIYVTLIDFTGSSHEDRNLELTAGTPEFDALWADIQELQFRRSPLNVVVQAFPFLENLSSSSKTMEDGDITHMFLDLYQVNGLPSSRTEQLRFWVDAWEYRDFDHGVNLPLVMKNAKDIGQSMAHDLWDQAEN